ncbi:MAG: hypothetical protein CK429_04190 [Mycobacterium sp.]|nr:MAG: hypothetical protein CK429_04190 [Mycobacterium sp.]
MPPLEPLDPPKGDIAPYPGEILTLGGNRWLTNTGRIITTESGVPVGVQDNTRRYWEGRAAKAGYTLADLLAE